MTQQIDTNVGPYNIICESLYKFVLSLKLEDIG